ncbi:lipase family protein [Bacillus vallismortis]|uniref:alpha/beta hydrolase family protein n=1 Tax=Bacillus vallismortis TaxID=72361 RepID=UPI0022802AAE|nr:lipase family protein [Bacillus vallismortis]MCY7891719.1 lipase family protein [Bacillus vallismortis]
MKKVLFGTLITSALFVGLILLVSTQGKNTVTEPAAAPQNQSISKEDERGALVSYEKVNDLTTKEINELNPEKNIGQLLDYDVSLYSITYESVQNGKPVVLSGLVTIPKGKEKPSLLQYHHGTMLPIPMPGGEGSNDVPSLFNGQAAQPDADFGETRMMILTFASKGYVVSAPDYAGYNVSKHLDHPYNIPSELANYSVDMIRATKELTKVLEVKTDSKLFLTGWSEGGGAALATHKDIEQKYSEEFNLIATSALAGPYDMLSMLQSNTLELEDDDLGENAGIYSWTLYSLLKFSNINVPLDKIYNYEVQNSLDALNPPSSKVSEFINLPFLQESIMSGDNEELVSAIEQLSLINDWVPKAKIMFHSGKNDDIVPHYNTLNAYNKFKKEGADVTLYEYNGDHYTPDLDYLTTAIKDFEKLSRQK